MTQENLQPQPFTEAELMEDETIASAADQNPDGWVPGSVADTYGEVPYVPALSTSHREEREANCLHAAHFNPVRVRRYIAEMQRVTAETAQLRAEPVCPSCGAALEHEANRGLWRCPAGCGAPATGDLESERQEIERLRAENEKLLERLRRLLG